MLEYYLPGLDASALSDNDFIQKVADLFTIRRMEKESKIDDVLNRFGNG